MPAAAKWSLSASVALIGAVLALYLHGVDLAGGSHLLPGCSLHQLTGLYCTGCGNTRAAQALLRGDVTGAFQQNALFVVAIPFLVYGGVRTWLHWVCPGKLKPLGIRWKYGYSVALIVLVVGFTLLRNIPQSPFSWLAPVSLTPEGGLSSGSAAGG